MTLQANFDLRLAGQPGSYTCLVLDSPAGQSEEVPMTCDLGSLSAETIGLSDAEFKEAGTRLWRCAFGDLQIAGLWRDSLGKVGEGLLRLRLRIDAPVNSSRSGRPRGHGAGAKGSGGNRTTGVRSLSARKCPC